MTVRPPQAPPWRELGQTVELEAGVSLIFLVGPDQRAPEGLRRAAEALPEGWQTRWHRLDRDGPDLATAADGPTTALLVHGLERMAWLPRLELLISLNLLRDRLRDARGAILLWVPRSLLDELVSRCPDLFSWRSLLVEVSEDDVPLERDLELRRDYLAHLLKTLDFVEPLGPGHPSGLVVPLRPMAFPPMVETAEGERVPFLRWARTVERAAVVGPLGSGRSVALRLLALAMAEEALDAGGEGELPILLDGKILGLGRFDLSVVAVRSLVPGAEQAGWPVEAWLAGGARVLFDESRPPVHPGWKNVRLQELSVGPTIVAARFAPAGWPEARMVNPSVEDMDACWSKAAAAQEAWIEAGGEVAGALSDLAGWFFSAFDAYEYRYDLAPGLKLSPDWGLGLGASRAALARWAALRVFGSTTTSELLGAISDIRPLRVAELEQLLRQWNDVDATVERERQTTALLSSQQVAFAHGAPVHASLASELPTALQLPLAGCCGAPESGAPLLMLREIIRRLTFRQYVIRYEDIEIALVQIDGGETPALQFKVGSLETEHDREVGSFNDLIAAGHLDPQCGRLVWSHPVLEAFWVGRGVAQLPQDDRDALLRLFNDSPDWRLALQFALLSLPSRADAMWSLNQVLARVPQSNGIYLRRLTFALEVAAALDLPPDAALPWRDAARAAIAGGLGWSDRTVILRDLEALSQALAELESTYETGSPD